MDNEVSSEKQIRILARRIARKLTEEEVKIVSGGECKTVSVGKATERGDQNDYPSMVCQ